VSVKAAVIHQAAYRQVIINPEIGTDPSGDWTPVGAGWAIAGGALTATEATGSIKQTVDPLTSGNPTKLFFVVTATLGKVVVLCGTTASAAKGAGTHNFDVTPNGAGFSFRPATAGEGGDASGKFTGTVDSVHAVPLKVSFTKSGFGEPKAAIFILSKGYTDGTEEAGASFGMGLTDGTRQYLAMGGSETGRSTTDTYRKMSNTTCAGYMKETDGTIILAGAFSSWPTDGVEILWSTIDGYVAGAISQMTVVLFGGTDLSARAGTFTSVVPPGDEDDSVTISDVGFEAANLVVVSCGSATAFGTLGNGEKLSVGFVDNAGGGVVTHASLNMTSADAVGTTDLRNHVSTAYAVAMPQLSDPAVYISDFGVNGFKAWTPAFIGSCVCFYLALKYNSKASHWVGVVDSPSSASGNTSFTNPGFKPQCVIHCPSAVTEVDVDKITDATGAGSFSIAAFDATASGSADIHDKDAVATTLTDNLVDAKPVKFYAGLGLANQWTATFVSFDATGWTLNYTTSLATARKWPTLVIGEGPVDFIPRVMMF